MNDQWKVFVEYRPGQLSTTFIYVSRRVSLDKVQYLTKGGEILQTVDTAKAFKDEVYFARFEDDFIGSLIVEALDKRGIKAPSQSFTEGKLQATEAHLNDLRLMIPKLSQTHTPNTSNEVREGK